MLIGELLLIGLVATMIFKLAGDYSNSEEIIVEKLADDITLTVNTFIGVPGDKTVSFYWLDLSKYEILLVKDRVIVRGEEGLEVTKYFYVPSNYDLTGQSKNLRDVSLKKTGKKIELKGVGS